MMNSELERIWMEAICTKVLSQNFLEILRNTTKSAVGLRTTFPVQDVCNMKHATHYTGLQGDVPIT
jgi:hypothetical protein